MCKAVLPWCVVRVPVDTIVNNFDHGLSENEISEQFQVALDRVKAILAYAKSHRIAHPARSCVPVGVRGFLAGHEVLTVVEMSWPPQLENGERLPLLNHSSSVAAHPAPHPHQVISRRAPQQLL